MVVCCAVQLSTSHRLSRRRCFAQSQKLAAWVSTQQYCMKKYSLVGREKKELPRKRREEKDREKERKRSNFRRKRREENRGNSRRKSGEERSEKEVKKQEKEGGKTWVGGKVSTRLLRETPASLSCSLPDHAHGRRRTGQDDDHSVVLTVSYDHMCALSVESEASRNIQPLAEQSP